MYGFRAKRGMKLYVSTAHQYITLRNPQIKLLSILIQFCSLDSVAKMNGINVFIFALIFTSVSLNKIEQNITRDDRICKRFQFLLIYFYYLYFFMVNRAELKTQRKS